MRTRMEWLDAARRHFVNIEAAMSRALTRLDVPERLTRCTLTHNETETRVVVRRLTDGATTTEIVFKDVETRGGLPRKAGAR